jgi:hypothetical protein
VWVVTGGQMILIPEAAASGTASMEFIAGSATETRVTGWTSARYWTRQADIRRGS